jgi:beta-lactamase class A
MRHGASMLRRLAAIPILALTLTLTLALALAACASPPIAPSDDPGPLGGPSSRTSSGTVSPFASLRGYLAARQGTVTAAVYDKHTGRTWILHGGLRQDTASIVKVEIMGAALREAETAGRPMPPDEQAMIRAMIENSDNDAATSMLARVGGPAAVQRYDALAGLDDTTVSTLAYIPGTSLPGWGLTKTTALDEVRLVKRFAYPNSLLAGADRRYGLDLMEHVESGQDWGVSAGVAQGTTVALKNGWLPLAGAGWQVNSIGWISGHGRDYVVAVLSDRNPSYAYGIDTIEAISRRIFAELGPRTTA